MSKEIYGMPGFLIRRLHQISVSVFEDSMKKRSFDLTPVQFSALKTIADNPGIDQQGISRLTAQDRVTVGGVIKRLLARNLIVQLSDQEDRRYKLHQVTDKGLQLLSDVYPAVLEAQAAMLSGLEEKEKEEFIRLMLKAADSGNQLSRAPLARELTP